MSKSILWRMALLREQRNLIRALHDFHGSDKTWHARQNPKGKIGTFFGSAEEVKVLAFLKTRRILLSDENKDIEAIKQDTHEFNDRSSKIGILYKSCKDAKFVEPLNIDVTDSKDEMKTTSVNIGVAITDKGTDLLNPLGFLNIFLEKYSRPITFFWGVISTILIGLTGWVLSNVDKISELLKLFKTSLN